MMFNDDRDDEEEMRSLRSHASDVMSDKAVTGWLMEVSLDELGME